MPFPLFLKVPLHVLLQMVKLSQQLLMLFLQILHLSPLYLNNLPILKVLSLLLLSFQPHLPQIIQQLIPSIHELSLGLPKDLITIVLPLISKLQCTLHVIKNIDHIYQTKLVI